MMQATRIPRGATPRSDSNSDGRSFPKRHLFLACGLLILVGIGMSLMPAGNVSARRIEVPVELGLEEATPLPEVAAVEETWADQTVRSGDNLSLIFKRAGLNDRAVYQVVNSAPQGKALTRIFPGQTLGFQLDDQGQLQALKHVKSRLDSVVYRRTEEGFSTEEVKREPEIRRRFATATIESSLFMAGQDAGLSQNVIMEMANIFGGVIDFVLDPRQGDVFHLLYEELYLDGEKLGTGSILAAEFINQGNSHTAFRYIDSNDKPGYFSEEGVSMRRAFLLSPVDFTRVSSSFNPRRLHPIYKTRKPHRGVDYAASRGTPVFAAGDGRVTASGYSKANGKYVVIQHGPQYTTKYLHLNKRKVRKGQKVSQQQVIGTVGSTGAATGPHLHYEFLVNGVHRNPRTIHKKLPKAESLPKSEMPRFEEQTNSLNMQLASLRQNHLAQLDTRHDNKTASL
jgi:murein DD-endopeptidase MepM/ murein hydrolase activator NlpD